MEHKLLPIEEKDFLKFFLLIDKNRSRLEQYFPNTIKSIQSKEDAKLKLVESDTLRIKKEQFLFGIFESEKIIGYINVKNIDNEISKCELGYFIDQSYEGQGIMTSQIKNVVSFCFENLKMMKVFLRIGKENIGSRKLAEKVGFEKEGILRNEFKQGDGTYIDLEYFGILNPNLLK